MTAADSPVTTKASELIARARQLLPTLAERAFETERLGRVPDTTVAEILATHLNRVGVPVRFGGLDVEFHLMHDIAIEFGRACGATSWCFALWGVHNWWVGYYPPEAQEEVYANGPDVLTSSAGFALESRAEPVAGGYRVSGHWQFSSGCDHAAYVFAVTDSPDGPMGTIIPRSDLRILEDTWNVSGLQGTGSKDLVIDDAFVPAHRTLAGRGNMYSTSAWSPREFHHQRRYTVPMGALLAWDLVAPAIGLAEGAVEEMVARLTGTRGRARAADSPMVQAKIAESSAEVDAARALMHADFDDAQTRGERDEPITPLDLARYGRDKAYCMKLAVSAVNRMFDMAGGHALFVTDPMQRMHRDVQACMHRDGMVFDFGGQPYGAARLGIDPSTVRLRR
ncbi:MAG: oxidoreductase [Chloroflexi bacterium]|nr:oxidoreductase [Chloroflexota bacterium]